MAIQIGKYKRPGIFLEEYDNSVIATPVVEGLTNLVIGVSKKGPVNTPVRITSVNDLESIFGTLDRGLERKGSFFHRTVSKMLETAPVFAMNVLLTDDALDTIEYKSISASSNSTNDIERLGAYRRFHNTTGFWKRDTDAFINLTKNNSGYEDRAFSLTNLSDRYATVFVFNSQVSGFDRTLIEWYGSVEKLPPYVNANDYASDYMVDVVIVAGDWSDYKALSIDPRWSAYFNASGLRKEEVRNFASDRNVTALAYYEGLSLIPYFRDANGRNVFIETTINRDTDKTGIFCAFNSEIVEEDYYNGKLDIIGQTIAGTNKKSIDFLSYDETIMSEVEFKANPLDLPGNVTALIGSVGSVAPGDMKIDAKHHAFADTTNYNPATSGAITYGENRTSFYAEEFLRNVKLLTSSTATGETMSVAYTIENDAYAVIGDNLITLKPQTLTFSVLSTSFATSSTVQNMTSAYVMDSTGNIKVLTSSKSDEAPTPAATDVVLGYATYSILKQAFSVAPAHKDLTVGTSKFKHMSDTTDYKVEAINVTSNFAWDPNGWGWNLPWQPLVPQGEFSGKIRITFKDTNKSPDKKDYVTYRRFKMFNRLIGLLDSSNRSKMTMLLKPNGDKFSLENARIESIETSETKEKSFVIDTGLYGASGLSKLNDVITKGFLVFYSTDNEQIFGTKKLITSDSAIVQNGLTGSVAKYSELYNKFYEGQINSGDFFYNNRIKYDTSASSNVVTTYDVTFVPGELSSTLSGFSGTGVTSSFAGNDYIVFRSNSKNLDPEFNLNDVIQIPGASINTGTFTIVSGKIDHTQFGGTSSDHIYQINENTTYEKLLSVDRIYDVNDKVHTLTMSFDGDKLNVEFDTELWYYATTNARGVKSNSTIYVNSADSNFKQTVEIELPTGYVEQPNKILVDAARYTEIIKGDFLEAEYDESTLAFGEAPRKLTRVVNKTQYTGNSAYAEITCDAKIKKIYTGAAYQTMRYKKVEDYVETYKAISLKGFRVRQASMPDGTEARQNQILNVVAKGTPLFKALTNKEAIDFRYLIDSFGNGLTERSKQQLVDICGERLDAFGFINMPSIKAFKNSSSPSFVNSEGVLQTEYIAKGADPASNPAFLYSFGDGAGTTCTGYFLPYVKVNDNGRPLDFPPASFVATTYMRKHTSNVGGITPWTIAAGVTNGRIIGINGLEADFNPTDIEWLNGAQINPIVFKRNRGHVIETENTAQTLYKSALSYIHVREVLIELERELSRMLLDFQWRFNTSDIRAEIKLRADVICETYVGRNGLYNYFNKMDEENNTAEIIDNQIGVLDTYVEPIKGMGIIVNNVTILRTGAIAAGGFL